MTFNTISVVGLGYIGLPTAAMFASRKKQVIGVDVNQHVVDTINRGEIHIVEPELDTIVRAAVTAGYLKAVTAAEPADAFLIAVPTPFKKKATEIPEPDVSYIEGAARSIAKVLKKGDLVILESTSPVGTTEQMAEWLAEARTDLSFPQQVGDQADVNVAHCPERVMPGNVVRELVENDRVIGGMTDICSQRAIELYKTFVRGDCGVTNARTAEMVKLTENSCRDVQIAFANELSVICDELSINVWELISLANRHPRINILHPGPGVGGHCIAVDPWFIVSKTPDKAKLIHTARNINDQKPEWVIMQVNSAISRYLANNPDKTSSDVSVACYGLAFKADLDDLRESPALLIAKKLAKSHPGNLWAIEPNVEALHNEIELNMKLVDLQVAQRDAQIHVLLVDHFQFKGMKVPADYVVDTRGCWGYHY
jgi:UDP-N-acetyl-D-mannosaminuronic acid dehydrogenase